MTLIPRSKALREKRKAKAEGVVGGPRPLSFHIEQLLNRMEREGASRPKEGET